MSKISEMTPATALLGDELIPVIQDGDNVIATPDQITAGSIKNNKVIIPAAAMLPMTTNSAYYLGGAFPAQVFSSTANEAVKIQLYDIGNQIPADANAIKVKVCGRRTQETVTGDFACWRVKAAWVNIGDTAITLGDPAYIVNDYAVQNQLSFSWDGIICIPYGDRSEGCELRIEIARDIAYEVESVVLDNLNAPAHLVWIEIEFVTVE